jgi:hypothetical protein
MNCVNIKLISSKAHKGYIPFTTKAENAISTSRKSAVISKHIPMDEDTPSLLAKYPSRASVTHAIRKIHFVHNV